MHVNYINPRSPNYIPPHSKYVCTICNESIHNGDEYIESWNGEMAHWGCICGVNHLLEWFGCSVETMEDVYD